MTRLAYSSMKSFWRTAKRTFVAKCGHKINRGEQYHVFDDYNMYALHHMSKCKACALKEA